MSKFSKVLTVTALAVALSRFTFGASADEQIKYDNSIKENPAVIAVEEKGFTVNNISDLSENNGEIRFKSTDNSGHTIEYRYISFIEKDVITIVEDGETDVLEYYDDGRVYVDGALSKTLMDGNNISPYASYASSYSTTKSSLSTGTYSRIDRRTGSVIFDNAITALTSEVVSKYISTQMGIPGAEDAIKNFVGEMKSLASSYEPNANSLYYTQSIYKDGKNYSGMYEFYRYQITYHYYNSPSKAMTIYRMDTLL